MLISTRQLSCTTGQHLIASAQTGSGRIGETGMGVRGKEHIMAGAEELSRLNAEMQRERAEGMSTLMPCRENGEGKVDGEGARGQGCKSDVEMAVKTGGANVEQGGGPTRVQAPKSGQTTLSGLQGVVSEEIEPNVLSGRGVPKFQGTEGERGQSREVLDMTQSARGGSEELWEGRRKGLGQEGAGKVEEGGRYHDAGVQGRSESVEDMPPPEVKWTPSGRGE